MRRTFVVVIAVLLAACHAPRHASTQSVAGSRASLKDTAFVRANCFMPDSVLAGLRPCIDRVQKLGVKVF
jgi:hypothetical protein